MDVALLVIQILAFLALVIYVGATWRVASANSAAARASAAAVEEMRAARAAESRPYVSVVAGPSRVNYESIELVVRNYGRTAAHAINVTFEPELQGTLPRLKELCVFLREGITFLAPGSEISTALGGGRNYVEKGLPLRYDIILEYSDDAGHRYSQTQCLDVTQGRGSAVVVDSDKQRVLEAAEASSEALASIARKLER
ncbi:MAG: hypothetical protein JXA87_12445 [Thermoleophilia bacterium]|nr:hypothetical protein [Thermoleophilia bacterium]